jgi:hypothetical protein
VPAQASDSAQLSVELGTGFAGADVTVVVDGKEVWHRQGVTTNYSVGLADVVRVPLPADPEPTVEVRVNGATQATTLSTPAPADEVRLRCDLDPAGVMTIGSAPEGPIF